MMRRLRDRIGRLTVGQKLGAIVVLLIVIPSALIGVLGFSLYAGGLRDRLAESATREIAGAAALVAGRIETVENYAKSVSYDFTLELAGRAVGSDEGRFDERFPELNRYLRDTFYLRPDCSLAAFSFTALPGRRVFTSTEPSGAQNAYWSGMHPRALAFADGLGFQPGYLVDGGRDVYLVRNLYDHITFRRFGVLVLKLNVPYLLDEFLRTPGWREGLSVEFNGETLAVGAGWDHAFAARDAGLIAQARKGQTAYAPAGGRSVIYGMQVPGRAELRFAVSIPTARLMSEYYGALGNIVLVSVCAIVPVSLLLVLLYRSIMVPVRRLIESMQIVKQGRYGVRIDLKRGDEFGYMVDSFNSMSAEIKHLFDTVYKEELALRDAQIMALQSQINPHFLYNTLELVNWQARLAGNEDISRVIESLGTILDASMDRNAERTVPLSQELRHADAYVFILRKRFGQKIRFERDIDETLLEAKVPRLILQPIIENAVAHGLEPTGGGAVTMRVRRHGALLLLEIENDGEDITPVRLEELLRMLALQPDAGAGSSRLGLRNVHERIRLIFGEGCGVTIKRREGGGVVVTMAMPVVAD